MLHQHPALAEAAARITWCARERALGVITGEVGSGKTVAARAAIAALDQTRHTLIYLADPTTGPAASTTRWSSRSAAGPPTAPPR